MLQQLVTYQAETRPDATALVCGPESMSYGDFERATNRLAHLLRAAGCRRGDRVGILLPKSIHAIVGMIGSLKADCTYVPMDTASPSARLTKIIEACEPKIILVGTGSLPVVADLPSRTSIAWGWFTPDDPAAGLDPLFRWSDLTAMVGSVPDTQNGPTDPAHILFTSGSTGVPKGVVITHANIEHFIRWGVAYFGMQNDDRISCHPPLHFDLSTFDIYGSFLAGAEAHLVPPTISLLPHKLAEFMRRSRLTQWFSVPSALKYLVQFDAIQQDDFPSLKRLLWCGEALPTPVLMKLMRRLPHVSFTNLYGPTETTIASSYYTVPACPSDDKAEIPIGVPCDGEELLVLDGEWKPTAVGEAGELYIKGPGLSPGYWRDPGRSNAVFLDLGGAGRMYKTGDLARIGEDGLVYLLGRADSQIKSRGYRIELGEIETALYALDVLRECAVVAVRSDGFDGVAICCAYVPREGQSGEPAEIRSRLMKLVPTYMLPSRWIRAAALPLNGNGKVDRPRLKHEFELQEETERAQGGVACNAQH